MKLDPKKVPSAVTLTVLGGVWLWMTYKGQHPPAMLTQGIVAAAGTLFAGTALSGALPKGNPDAKTG